MAEKSNPVFVIDASFVLSFLLNEGNKKVEKLFLEYINGKIDLISTTLLSYEVGNGLRSAVLRKRLSKEKSRELYKSFIDFALKSEEINYPDVLKMALLKNISFYDASYIYLADKLSLQFLTLD